jgi:hypothetical protein
MSWVEELAVPDLQYLAIKKEDLELVDASSTFDIDKGKLEYLEKILERPYMTDKNISYAEVNFYRLIKLG